MVRVRYAKYVYVGVVWSVYVSAYVYVMGATVAMGEGCAHYV